MKKLRILIADDEMPARNKMKRMLEQLAEGAEILMAENGEQALETILSEKPDIAFLDIEMPGKTGLEVAEALLEEEIETAIIFATAYNEHAIKAFELNAMDYLLKPFNEERLKSALDRALKNRNAPSKEAIESVKEVPDPADELNTPFANKIPVATRDRYKLIDYDEVVCIEVEERSVRLYTMEKSYLLNYPLETFEKRLPNDKFFRISRSTIISFSQVKEIVIWFGNRFKIILNNDKEVISSREKSKVLKHVLKI